MSSNTFNLFEFYQKFKGLPNQSNLRFGINFAARLVALVTGSIFVNPEVC